MKKLQVAIILFPIFGLAQEVKPIKSIAIPRVDMPMPDKKPEESTTAPQYSINKPFEPKLFKYPTKTYEEPKLEKPGIGNQPKSDLDVGKQYADKMNKQFQKEGTGDAKIFRRNMHFGEFQTESETIKIYYRDIGVVDGDKIRVWADNKVVFDNVILNSSRDYISLGLIEGINFIEIEAINEGTYFPNTGEVIFTELEGKIISGEQWFISEGYRATINIYRVPKGTLKKLLK